MVKDPYKVLGVSPDADAETIKQAYRKLAKQYHPDLHPGDEYAAKRMNEINEAYDLIKNPQAYRQQQQQQAWQTRQTYTEQDPFAGFYGSGPWYTGTQTDEQQEPDSQYSWTFTRPQRRGSCLLRLVVIYLVFQLFFSLFSGCSRLLFSPYRSYYGQAQSSYSDSYEAPKTSANLYS